MKPKAPPQISTSLPSFVPEAPGDWSHLIDFARTVDEAGFDRLVLSDHVVFGENLSAYADPTIGGALGGRQPTGPDGAWLEPLATIAHLTAVTSRVRFGTNILIAALNVRWCWQRWPQRSMSCLAGASISELASDGNARSMSRPDLSFESCGRLLNQAIEVV